MEQADLRRWESQCIQEEVPKCVASCPLHVDAKTFCSLMGQRRWDKAWAVLAKTMPLPGVLARLCDAPCQNECVRKDAGGSIEMGNLERFCANNAKPVSPPHPLPSRGKSVAVIGADMTGLCATWELARRGFDVTLYCSVPGGTLLDLPDETLPQTVIEQELSSLVKMGVSIEIGVKYSQKLIDLLLETLDAVFVDSESMPVEMLSYGEPDELTLGTQHVGLFASRSGESSYIFQAAVGRRAANSIERFTQGVSMVSGRELEGPYETRLVTTLDMIPLVPSISTVTGYAEDEARDEAKRCIQCECMECVKSCEYLKHYKSYPKVYARQIYNNESIVMGTRQANTMINSCMLCGLCETICPEDFSMAEVCLEARRTMVERDNMPPSAHEFALRDMAFANGKKCALDRHAPRAGASEYLFFPGCQLTASDPDGVAAAYADLRERLGNVGIMLHCCGAPAEWSGRQALVKESTDEIKRKWMSLGSPKIITACPTCLKILRQELPDAEITTHWSILRALGLPQGVDDSGKILAINDSCAARHNPMLREDIRALLEELKVEVVEPELTGEKTECCGYGGLLSEANPELGRAVAERRARVVPEDFITYCAMCRDMILKTGKKAMHLYELLYPRDGGPRDSHAPGYSERRENRVRLKEQLLRDLWVEDDGILADPWESVEVVFTESAVETMEVRRILKSDVQKVLHQARESGRGLVNNETGYFLASFRPVVVTYWVEYELQGDGYLVHNAWSHRMLIKGGQI